MSRKPVCLCHNRCEPSRALADTGPYPAFRPEAERAPHAPGRLRAAPAGLRIASFGPQPATGPGWRGGGSGRSLQLCLLDGHSSFAAVRISSLVISGRHKPWESPAPWHSYFPIMSSCQQRPLPGFTRGYAMVMREMRREKEVQEKINA